LLDVHKLGATRRIIHMKYIWTSIEFIKTNPALILLFVSIGLIMMPFQMLRYLDNLNILTAVIGLFLGAFSLYLMAGLYSCIWRTFSERSSCFKNIINYSNYYFSTYFLVFIVVDVVIGGCMLWLINLHRTVYYPAIDLVTYSKQFDADLVRSVLFYSASIMFAFILPAVYVGNELGFKIIKTAFKFIINNFSVAVPVIVLITLSFTMNFILGRLAVTFDYSSVTYWLIMTLSRILVYAIEFLLFITAAQIFKDNFKDASNHALKSDTALPCRLP
jgi:hypothetical protein